MLSTFSSKLTKPSKDISLFSPTMVGGQDGLSSLGTQDRLISAGSFMAKFLLSTSNSMTDVGVWLVVSALHSAGVALQHCRRMWSFTNGMPGWGGTRDSL